jgi:hypothetical protein
MKAQAARPPGREGKSTDCLLGFSSVLVPPPKRKRTQARLLALNYESKIRESRGGLGRRRGPWLAPNLDGSSRTKGVPMISPIPHDGLTSVLSIPEAGERPSIQFPNVVLKVDTSACEPALPTRTAGRA